MSKQLLITHLCHTQVAVVESGRLCRLLSDSQDGQAGDVYLAKVVRVLPALDVAFLDIGESKNALMSLTKTKVVQGQMILVQLTRPAHAQKGATVSTDLCLSSPYVVYRPQGVGVKISAKIDKSTAKALLNTTHQMMAVKSLQGGVTIRTSAKDIDVMLIDRHLSYLADCYQQIRLTKRATKTVGRIHRMPLVWVALSEHADIDGMCFDDRAMYEYWSHFADRYVPHVSVDYQKHLFDVYRIYDKVYHALQNRVDLPSGAYLIIDECEAMTVIDVNTGTSVHSSQNVIYQTNLEAVGAIASELMLRQIGGLVVIDFIDMKQKHHQDLIFNALKQAFLHDVAKVHVLPMSELGLVQLSREQRLLTFSDKYTTPCPTCQGRGRLPSGDMVCLDIIVRLRGIMDQWHGSQHSVVLRLSQPLYDELLKKPEFQDIVSTMSSSLHLKIMSDYPQDKYDILENKSR